MIEELTQDVVQLVLIQAVAEQMDWTANLKLKVIEELRSLKQ